MKTTTSKIELFASAVTKKTEEKTTITPQSKINKQKSIKSKITMTTTPMFQHMKNTPMLFLAQETLIKPITCSKCKNNT